MQPPKPDKKKDDKDPTKASLETEGKLPQTQEALAEMIGAVVDKRMGNVQTNMESMAAALKLLLAGRQPRDRRGSISASPTAPLSASLTPTPTPAATTTTSAAASPVAPAREEPLRSPFPDASATKATPTGLAPPQQGIALVQTMMGRQREEAARQDGDHEPSPEEAFAALLAGLTSVDDREIRCEERKVPRHGAIIRGQSAPLTPAQLITLFGSKPLLPAELPVWLKELVARAPPPKATMKSKADIDNHWWLIDTIAQSLGYGGVPNMLDRKRDWNDPRSMHEARVLALAIHFILIGRPDLAVEVLVRRYEGVLMADQDYDPKDREKSRHSFEAANALALVSDSVSAVSVGRKEQLQRLAPASSSPSTPGAAEHADGGRRGKKWRTGAAEDAAAAAGANTKKGPSPKSAAGTPP